MLPTREDVLAAARRLFPDIEQGAVVAQLDAYGSSPAEPERNRVQLAILKLSLGSIEKLRHFIEAARSDYRDVLHWSEHTEESSGKSLIDVLREHWDRALPGPVIVHRQNPFGNLLVEVDGGSILRVCPEDLSAERLADSAAALAALLSDDEFRTDWEARSWVESAETTLGPLSDGQCYGFRVWPVLGAEYSTDNMVIKTLLEWIAASGEAGRQVKDLPPGTPIRLDTGNT